MMNPRTACGLLEVSGTASKEEISGAYKKLALKFHPDKNPEIAESATEAFQLIQYAKELLFKSTPPFYLPEDSPFPEERDAALAEKRKQEASNAGRGGRLGSKLYPEEDDAFYEKIAQELAKAGRGPRGNVSDGKLIKEGLRMGSFFGNSGYWMCQDCDRSCLVIRESAICGNCGYAQKFHTGAGQSLFINGDNCEKFKMKLKASTCSCGHPADKHVCYFTKRSGGKQGKFCEEVPSTRKASVTPRVPQQDKYYESSADEAGSSEWDDSMSGLFSSEDDEGSRETKAITKIVARSFEKGRKKQGKKNVFGVDLGSKAATKARRSSSSGGAGAGGKVDESKIRKKSLDEKRRHFDAADLIGTLDPSDFGERLFRNKPNVWAAKIRKRREANKLSEQIDDGEDAPAEKKGNPSLSPKRSKEQTPRVHFAAADTEQAGSSSTMTEVTPRKASGSTPLNSARRRSSSGVASSGPSSRETSNKSGDAKNKVSSPVIRARHGSQVDRDNDAVSSSAADVLPHATASSKASASSNIKSGTVTSDTEKLHQQMKAGLKKLVEATAGASDSSGGNKISANSSKDFDSGLGSAAATSSKEPDGPPTKISPTKLAGMSPVRPSNNAEVPVMVPKVKIGAPTSTSTQNSTAASSSRRADVPTTRNNKDVTNSSTPRAVRRKVLTGDPTAQSSFQKSAMRPHEAPKSSSSSSGESVKPGKEDASSEDSLNPTFNPAGSKDVPNSNSATSGATKGGSEPSPFLSSASQAYAAKKVPGTRSYQGAAQLGFKLGGSRPTAAPSFTYKSGQSESNKPKTKSFMAKIFEDEIEDSSRGANKPSYLGSFGQVEMEFREENRSRSNSITSEIVPPPPPGGADAAAESGLQPGGLFTRKVNISPKKKAPSMIGADMQNQYLFNFAAETGGQTSDFSVISNGDEYVAKKLENKPVAPGTSNFVSNSGRKFLGGAGGPNNRNKGPGNKQFANPAAPTVPETNNTSPRKKKPLSLYSDDDCDDAYVEELLGTDEDFWRVHGGNFGVIPGSSQQAASSVLTSRGAATAGGTATATATKSQTRNGTAASAAGWSNRGESKPIKRDLGKIKFDRLVAKYDT